MKNQINCSICQKAKPSDVLTVRQKWVSDGGFGIVPPEAIVHPACDKKEQRQIRNSVREG